MRNIKQSEAKTTIIPFTEPTDSDHYEEKVRELEEYVDKGNFKLIDKTCRMLTQNWPDDPLGWKMLGMFSGIENDFNQAKFAFRNYVSIMISRDEDQEAQKTLTNFYHTRRVDDFQLKAIIRQEIGQLFTFNKWKEGGESELSEQGILWVRLEHESKQLSYLLKKGYDIPNLKLTQNKLLKLYNHSHSLVDPSDPLQWVKTDLDMNEDISISFNQILHFHNCKPLANNALNSKLDWRKFQDDFLSKDVPLACIDEFLSVDALEQMQEFCLSSTIWKRQFPDAYLGATIDGGFVSELHLKITHELNEFMPLIFQPLQLINSVAFKYHPDFGTGQALHADDASVGINLWTTPDSANLDSESGGVIIYDVMKPKGWNINNPSEMAQNYLEGVDCTATRVPYQCNRAVLFNPSFFHKSEKIKFDTDYENWRTNITFFYDRPTVQ